MRGRTGPVGPGPLFYCPLSVGSPVLVLKEITIACGNYDRVWPLLDGRVRAEGLDLRIINLQPEECFWRMLNYEEFDAAEMSLGSYWQTRAQGDERFIGIPVFLSRFFRHSMIYLPPASPIRSARDLEGKRIGVPEYQMTAAVWLRGILQHDFEVDLDEITWVTGGLEQPGRRERQPLRLSHPVRIEQIDDNSTLSAALAAGEIDALMSPRVPPVFRDESSGVRRLFPDYATHEVEFFRRTRIFPIMHLVVMRTQVYHDYPWVAESLNKAFNTAKDVALRGVPDAPALTYAIPGLLDVLERQRAVFGDDPWPYGYEHCRHELDTFAGYLHEQGLTGQKIDPKTLFAPNTVTESRI